MEAQLLVRDGKLSVAIMVRNEESCIKQCLESIRDADEIVIVDTGSIDNTIEIIQKYAHRIYYYAWNDNFSEVRNFVSRQCSGEWILSIDADEELEKNGIKKIKKLIKNEKEDAIYLTIYSKDKTLKYFNPKLYRNDARVFWCGRAHIYLNIQPQKYSDIKIYRGWSKSHNLDPDRTIRILKKSLDADSNLMRERFYLGKEYAERHKWPDAIIELTIYVYESKDNAYLAEAYLLLAKSYHQIGKDVAAKDMASMAMGKNPDFKEAIEYMAFLENGRNRYRWSTFSKKANNTNVLFIRNKSWLDVVE